MSTAVRIGRTRWRERRRGRSAARTNMDLMGHLRELRRRMVLSLGAFIGLSVIAFFFYPVLLELIRRPLCALDPSYLGPQGCDLIFTKVGGGFAFRLKVTALAGIFLAAPVWLYQLWAFVTPGLTKREKKYALPFVFTSVLLFIAGGAIAYLALPQGLRLLLTIGGEGLVALLDAEKYLSFVGLMVLGFGVMFEMPIFLFFLGLVGVLTSTQLRKQRRLAGVSIVALAAVVTPSQDPYTLLALSVPLYLLYESTIIALRLVDKGRAKRELKNA